MVKSVIEVSPIEFTENLAELKSLTASLLYLFLSYSSKMDSLFHENKTSYEKYKTKLDWRTAASDETVMKLGYLLLKRRGGSLDDLILVHFEEVILQLNISQQLKLKSKHAKKPALHTSKPKIQDAATISSDGKGKEKEEEKIDLEMTFDVQDRLRIASVVFHEQIVKKKGLMERLSERHLEAVIDNLAVLFSIPITVLCLLQFSPSKRH